MTRRLRLFMEFGVVLAVLMPPSAPCGDTSVNGKTGQEFTVSTCKEFFASDRQDVPEVFRPYFWLCPKKLQL